MRHGQIGVALLSLMIDSCKIMFKDPETGDSVEEPAFRHELTMEWAGTRKSGLWKRYGTIICHPEVLTQLNSDHKVRPASWSGVVVQQKQKS